MIETKHREAINLAVLQLREDGTLEGLKTKWWKERSECNENEQSSSSSKVYPFLVSYLI